MNKRSILTLIAVSSSFLLISHNAQAQATSAVSPSFGQNRNTIQSRCERLTQNVDSKLARFENNKKGHGEAFANMQNRLNKLALRLGEKGYNVTALEEDLNVLDDKIMDFGTDYQVYIESLKTSKNYACGESVGEFTEQIKLAKDDLQTLRDDVADIKDFYKTTIKPHILEIRAQNAINSSQEDQ